MTKQVCVAHWGWMSQKSVKDEEWTSGPGRSPSGKAWLGVVPRTLSRIVTVLPVSYILIFYFLFVVLGIEPMDPGV